jgi:GNAT superfamily N-acetyltransferase
MAALACSGSWQRLRKALLASGEPAVCDESSSVIDRQVGKVCSYAVAKTVRRRGQKFVAISCHTDIEPWLGPDWVYRTDAGEFSWRSVQPRPAVQLDIAPVPTEAWEYFKQHHYLTASLPGGKLGSWCAWAGDTPVAFTYVARFPHAKVRDIAKVARIVTMPDWQGLGIAARLLEFLGGYYTARRNRVRITTLHPGLLGYLRASPQWRYTGRAQPALIVGPKSKMRAKQTSPRGLQLGTFEFRRAAGQ